jgi:WD40 repeat protein
VAFSPNGRWLAFPTEAAAAELHDATTGALIRFFPDLSLTGVVTSLAFSADSRRLASIDTEGRVSIWEVPAHLDGRMLGLLLPPLSPSGFAVEAALATSAEPTHTFQAHSGRAFQVALSGDDRLLATSGIDGLIKLWDASTWAKIRVLSGHQGGVQSIVFSRCGRYLVSGGHDATVRVWDVPKGEELLSLHGHTDKVYSVAISPDNARISSGSSDRTVRVWDVVLPPATPSRKQSNAREGGGASPRRQHPAPAYSPK